MKKLFLLFALASFTHAAAQHDHHQPQPKDTAKKEVKKNKSTSKDHPQHQHDGHDSMTSPMSHSYSLNLPMTRNGSGTGWVPDSTVMYGHGIMTENWMFMFHANMFLRYNWQDVTHKSNRGGQKFDAPNMFMFMGQRTVGSRGLFHFSTMLSLDPLTVGAEGYPLLFQSGETYQNQPLVDRQHPHDLFSELSVAYTHAFNKDVDLTGYFGFPGEPAIGPVAFMHRNSAMNNPDAPLGHHWQDATHITFGVATIGLRVRDLKAEGSVFTGREPDENRYDFDEPKFDSYSIRVLYNPNPFLAFQLSQAYIKSPEHLHPNEDVARTTASAMHNLPLGGRNRFVATSAVWGYNKGHSKEHSVLVESNLQLDRFAVYGRYEWLQKSAEELNLDQFEQEQLFNIQALTVGANYVFMRAAGTNFAIGAQGSVFAAPQLNSLYGKNPLSAEVYLRFYPDLMHMHHHNM